MGDYVGNGGTYGSLYGFNASINSLDGPLVPSASLSGRIVRFTNITKGTSNTLLVGEKYLDKLIATTQSDCNDDQGWTDGWDNDTICYAYGASSSTPTPPQRDGTATTCGLVFGGPHWNGIQVVLCDGSVRSVSYSVNPNAWVIFCQATGNGILDLSSF